MLKMAQEGMLPKRLANVRPPKCAACMIGKATKRPWRVKGPVNTIRPRPVTKPGDVVSVDQLESTAPGLIPQMRGFITKRRFHFATVFVDQFSGLSFVFLQETSDAVETLRAKTAFEAFASTKGVIIRHWHADNGRFAEKAWMNDCAHKGQTITFCGVHAHHQNGVAEKRIRDLQEAARTSLIHAKRRWPDAIDEHLWPFALRSANHVHNTTISNKSGRIPLHDFSQIDDVSSPRNLHTFGCPCFVLDEKLQAGNRLSRHKWNDRARVAVNLGPSPMYTCIG